MDRGTLLIRQPVRTINNLLKKTNISLIQTFNVLPSCVPFFSFVTRLHLKRREMAKQMCLCLLLSFMSHIFSLEHGLWGKMLFFSKYYKTMFILGGQIRLMTMITCWEEGKWEGDFPFSYVMLFAQMLIIPFQIKILLKKKLTCEERNWQWRMRRWRFF